MAIFKTLKEMQRATDSPTVSDGGGDVKFLYLKDGEQRVLRFRQELTLDSENYDPEVGAAERVLVHVSPTDFRKKAVCTADKEEYNYNCWACSRVTTDSAWKPKAHLLINVAVKDEDTDEWVPMVLDQKFTGAHIASDLLEFAIEYGTIVDRDYKLKRRGSRRDTQYSITPLSIRDRDPEIDNLPVRDLSRVFRLVPPAEQAEFYTSSDEDTESTVSAWK